MRKSTLDLINKHGIDDVIAQKEYRINYLKSLEAPNLIVEKLEKRLKELNDYKKRS